MMKIRCTNHDSFIVRHAGHPTGAMMCTSQWDNVSTELESSALKEEGPLLIQEPILLSPPPDRFRSQRLVRLPLRHPHALVVMNRPEADVAEAVIFGCIIILPPFKPLKLSN